MEMHMRVQTGAKAVNKGHSADAQTCRVGLCPAGAVFMQAVLHDPQENAQRGVERRAIALHEVAQPLWH